MKPYKIILVLLTVALAAVSCNKEEEETSVTPSLEGSLTLSQKFPSYVERGAEFLIVPGGVSLPSSDTVNTVGYFYYLSTDTSYKDTSRIWYVQIPEDTLCNVTLYGYAYASGYSLKSVTTSTVIVDDNLNGTGSIKGFDLKLSDRFIVGASGRYYYYTDIDNTTWLRQNLAEGPAGHPRKECECVSYVFGRYYTWEEAVKACPEGWELPKLSDWDMLNVRYSEAGKLMGNVTFNAETADDADKKMWEYSPKVATVDSARLCILPSGYAQVQDNYYDYLGVNKYAVFWTADEDPLDPDCALTTYFYYDRNEMFTGSRDKKSFAASVRCIRRNPS